MATQADLDQKREWLTEAEQARHQIAIGDKTRVVARIGGNRREFHISDLDKLDAYIERLKGEIREIEDELGQTRSGRRRSAIEVRC